MCREALDHYFNGAPNAEGIARTANGTYTEQLTSSSGANGNFSFTAVGSGVMAL